MRNDIEPVNLSCYLAGKPVVSATQAVVKNPYTGKPGGTVGRAAREHADAAIAAASGWRLNLTRFQRFQVLDQSRQSLEGRAEEFAGLITAESGLCLRDT